MSCARFADAILEHALGEPAPAELQSHLRGCAACSAALERERQLAGRLDGELRAALDVAPSAALLPRVRARAAAHAERRSSPWLRWLLPVAAAAATLALVAWLRQPTTLPPGPAAAARVEPRRETPAPLAPVVVARTRSAKPSPAARPADPEVLVPPGQEAALLRFVATMRSGRVDAAALAQPDAAELAIAPLAELPALEVKPLAADANPEGVIP
jgi:hypothetical protein